MGSLLDAISNPESSEKKREGAERVASDLSTDDLFSAVDGAKKESAEDGGDKLKTRVRARKAKVAKIDDIEDPEEKAKAEEENKELKVQEIADYLASDGQKFEYDKTTKKLKATMTLEEMPERAPGKKVDLEDILPKDVRQFKLEIKDKDGKSQGAVKVQSELTEDGKVAYYFQGADGEKHVLKNYDLPESGVLEINAEIGETTEAQDVAARVKESGQEAVRGFGSSVRGSLGSDVGGGLVERKVGMYGTADSSPALDKLPAVKQEGEVLKDGSHVLANKPDEEALNILKNFDPNEKLVEFVDPYSGGKFKLRETTYKCLQYAKTLAQKDGLDIGMRSAYRSYARQKAIADANPSDVANGLIARPGKSWHQTGGTNDVFLVDKNTKKQLNGEKAHKQLEYYMNRAGYVRYRREWWHFEIGSTHSAAMVLSKLGKNQTYTRLA